MASRLVTYEIDDVIGMLRALCDKAGGQKAFSDKYGLSPAYVSDVLSGRRDPGDSILVALGLAKVTLYVPARQNAVEK